MLIALLLALLTLGASNVLSDRPPLIPASHVEPIGIALGQTARVNVLNLSDRAIMITAVKFLDEEGDLLAEFRERTIEPGKTISFDLNRDDLIREGNRIEIHPVIEIPERRLRDVAISGEVFNNADGKTTGWRPLLQFTTSDRNTGTTNINGPPVGIAIGQTARVNVLNLSDGAIIITGVKFYDEEGDLLDEFREITVESGKTISFDLDRDDLVREGNRIQIHVAIEMQQPHMRFGVFSQEVFNNADGKTTIGIGFNSSFNFDFDP
jgi:hypothetical protein